MRVLALLLLLLSSVAAAEPVPPPSPVATPPPDAPPAASHVVVGPHADYRPLLTFEPKGILIQGSLSLAGRVEGFSSFALDRDGTRLDGGAAISPQLRLGLRIDTREVLKVVGLAAEYEHDLATGYWSSVTPPAGLAYPNSEPIDQQLRKLSLRISLGRALHVGGGFTTNHFGMGLLANDGAHGWEPGSGRFVDPRGGDRVLRGYVALGPLGAPGLFAVVAADQVRGDDVLLVGDSAWQIIGSIGVGQGKPWGAGLFFVHRHQENVSGRMLQVSVLDFAGRFKHTTEKGLQLSLEAEAALVAGTTSLAPTPDFPIHEVLQGAASLRGQLMWQSFGGAFDFIYTSGDGNPDDRTQNGFKADPNHHVGMVLFRYVAAAQSARGVATAGDRNLVGEPALDLDRLPTRGSVTNTIAVFPRLVSRPAPGLEIYGGALFAWSATDVIDPFNTRIAGGAPRNATNAAPGRYWGTEFDAGLRYRMLLRGTELQLGAEVGVLAPGSALAAITAKGAPAPADQVWAGRLMIQYRL